MENNEMNDKKEKAFEGGEKHRAEQPEKKGKKAKKKGMNSEKKFYLFTAVSCAVVLLAIIIVAVAVTNAGEGVQTGGLPPITSDTPAGGENGGGKPRRNFQPPLYLRRIGAWENPPYARNRQPHCRAFAREKGAVHHLRKFPQRVY